MFLDSLVVNYSSRFLISHGSSSNNNLIIVIVIVIILFSFICC